MLIANTGIKTDNYYLPPFNLKEGEFVVIHLHNGAHYYDLKMELVDIFTRKMNVENIQVYRAFSFVNYFGESNFRRIFHPIRVGEYIKKNAGNDTGIAEKIYETSYINNRTRVNSLAATSRKLLSLYSTLSHSQNIIFDLDGLDPLGAKEIYEIVKSNVGKGGSAILLDWTDDMKNDCAKFITIEMMED